MRQCDYYLCSSSVFDDVDGSLGFCDYHLRILDELIETAKGVDEEIVNKAVAYCLAAITGKAYRHSHSVH